MTSNDDVDEHASNDETPPEEQPLASPEDFRIKRDEHGELQPVREPVPGMDKTIECIPLPDGAANRLIPETLQPEQMSDEAVVEVLDEWIVEPDFDIDPDEDPEDVLETFKAFPLTPLMQAVYNASGYEVINGMLMEDLDGEQFASFLEESGIFDEEDELEGEEGNSTSSPGSGAAGQSTS